MEEAVAFQNACKGSSLADVQRLSEGKEEVSAYCWVLACTQGQPEIAQWLAQRFGIGLTTVRAHECYVFRQACRAGKKSTVEWLYQHYGLNAKDVRRLDHCALRAACKGGHLAIAEWLGQAGEYTNEELDQIVGTAGGETLGPKSALKN